MLLWYWLWCTMWVTSCSVFSRYRTGCTSCTASTSATHVRSVATTRTVVRRCSSDTLPYVYLCHFQFDPVPPSVDVNPVAQVIWVLMDNDIQKLFALLREECVLPVEKILYKTPTDLSLPAVSGYLPPVFLRLCFCHPYECWFLFAIVLFLCGLSLYCLLVIIISRCVSNSVQSSSS